MARMAVVGCEGSGKTVFMSALADYYRPNSECGVCLVPDNSAANRFAAFQRRQMRALRQWPPATNPEKTVRLEWSLRRGGETLVEIGMLEFGGETFRAAFRGDGGDAAKASAVEELLTYLSDVDIVVVLVSIRDLMLDQRNLTAEEFERDAEALWVTRGILDFVARERPSANVIIGLTRADQYRAELEAAGGASALFAARWPTVGAAAAKVPVVAVASVSAVDDAGMPAEGFSTDGILPAMREVSRLRYGDTDKIVAELSSLRSELRSPAAGKSFDAYTGLLRKFSDRFSDLKAAAAITGADIARESEEIESALVEFRAAERALSDEEDRRRERQRHPLVRRRYLVALLAVSALLAASQVLPLDRIVAKIAERVERSRWTVAAPTQQAAANVAPAVAETNAPPAESIAPSATNDAVAVSAPPAATNAPAAVAAPAASVATNAVPEVAVTNAPPSAAATNAAPAVAAPAATNAAPAAANAAPVAAAETPRTDPRPVVRAAAPTQADKAFATFSNRLERAKAGDLKCMRWLGNQYYKGTEAAPRDFVTARRWYRAAAEGGDARAQACIGVMCEYGEGGAMLPSEAISWYRKAAEGGVAEAMFRLGVNLWEGAVNDPNAAKEAFDWLLKAKAAGCKNEDLDAWILKAVPRGQ